MKKFIALFLISGIVLAIGNSARTLYLENITSKKSNQDITVTPTGTGEFVIDTNTSMQVPVGTTAQRPSGASGDFRFNSENLQFEGYNGSAWGTIGGSGSGGINYLEDNPDFEANDDGYVEYADAAADVPVDGTGGSATSTFARNTTTPLRGNGDGLFSKPASNEQGEGFAYDFSIANSDQAQKLTITFEYDASDADYADGDIKIFVYDKTNTNLIRVNGEDLQGGKGKHYAQFQTASDSTEYRLSKAFNLLLS